MKQKIFVNVNADIDVGARFLASTMQKEGGGMKRGKPSNRAIKARLLEYRVRQTIILLEQFGAKCNPAVKIDDKTGTPFIACTIQLNNNDKPFKFNFPLTKLGRRFVKELRRLDKSCFCGTVKMDDVKTLFVALSNIKTVYKYRTRLRKATGLVKDKKLRSYLIWRRIRAKKLIGGERASGLHVLHSNAFSVGSLSFFSRGSP